MFGEELCVVYDCVYLFEFFVGKLVDDLLFVEFGFFECYL